MKKFHFQLESALTWRRQKEQTARLKLDDLAALRTNLEHRKQQVELEWHEVREQTLTRQSIPAEELSALHSCRRAADNKQRAIDRQVSTLEAEIERQRVLLVEASRQTKLLEKLKQRRLTNWQLEAGKVLEQEASELYLSQWAQNRSLD